MSNNYAYLLLKEVFINYGPQNKPLLIETALRLVLCLIIPSV